jgi:hypothetical protein
MTPDAAVFPRSGRCYSGTRRGADCVVLSVDWDVGVAIVQLHDKVIGEQVPLADVDLDVLEAPGLRSPAAGGVISLYAAANMRARGGRWASYRNEAMDSAALGTRRFRQFGPGCTVPDAASLPERYPDARGMSSGWPYRCEGEVDLELFRIKPLEMEVRLGD